MIYETFSQINGNYVVKAFQMNENHAVKVSTTLCMNI